MAQLEAETDTNPVSALGVIGAGTMGHGIAQTAILAGVETTLIDIDSAALDRALESIGNGLERLVSRDRISDDDRNAALARLQTSSEMTALTSVDAVIEAASERIELKRTLFEQIDAVADEALFIASNTSSIPIQQIAVALAPERRARAVGLHYFNPAQVLPLVEVVRPLTASDEAIAAAEAFVRATGKTPIAAQDTPAFIVNRLFVPMALDALRMWESGVASAEDIDRGCQLGLGHNMGPLATSDLVGLDVLLDVSESMFEELRDPHVAPPTILRRLVAAGRLGRKSGHGVFDYSEF